MHRGAGGGADSPRGPAGRAQLAGTKPNRGQSEMCHHGFMSSRSDGCDCVSDVLASLERTKCSSPC